MAIDTEGRRRSTLHVLPVPDGTIAAADRAHVLWIYSGIAIGAPVIVVIKTLLANLAHVLHIDQLADSEFIDQLTED